MREEECLKNVWFETNQACQFRPLRYRLWCLRFHHWLVFCCSDLHCLVQKLGICDSRWASNSHVSNLKKWPKSSLGYVAQQCTKWTKTYLIFGKIECMLMSDLLEIRQGFWILGCSCRWNDSIDPCPSVWQMQCNGRHRRNQSGKRSRTCQKRAWNLTAKGLTSKGSSRVLRLRNRRLFPVSKLQSW